MHWLELQRDGWRTGERLSFAVRESDRIVGHVVVKRSAAHDDRAEVGYWTAAEARGRGIATRALETLTDWAFTTLAGLTRLELLHQIDNPASCRVAQKSGYTYHQTLPARPRSPWTATSTYGRRRGRAAPERGPPPQGPSGRQDTTRAPGAGDEVTRAVRQLPEVRRASDTVFAESSSFVRNAVVGPEPETRDASAPADVPVASVVAREGRRKRAAGWRSLVRVEDRAVASPVRRAVSRAGSAAGGGTWDVALRRSNSA